LRSGDIGSARHSFAIGSDASVWACLGAFNPHAGEIDDVAIADMRLQLVAGEPSRVLSQISAERQAAEAAGRGRRGLRLLFLEAQALEAVGRRREAVAAFDQAVKRAAEAGMVRLLADETWTTEALAVRSGVAGVPSAVALLREMKALPAALNSEAQRDAVQDGPGGTFRLTTREVQILRLVWKGSSNKAIAKSLFLTENTVETHLRRIYQKLGTRKRTQAAAIAREAGVI
jgi:LuxR family maltose regulon positive regulatory protein